MRRRRRAAASRPAPQPAGFIDAAYSLRRGCLQSRDRGENQVYAFGPSSCFHRVDDVYAHSPDLRTFLDAFAERGLACVISVIPALLTREMADYLARRENFVVFQHGFEHINRGGEKNDEFPTSFPIAQARKNIAIGRATLQDRIGREVLGYTPPWNHTADSTIALLSEIGFTLLSCGKVERLRTQMRQMHARVDTLASYRPVAVRPKAEILRDIASEMRAGRPVGIVHHIKGFAAGDLDNLTSLVEQLAPFNLSLGDWRAALSPGAAQQPRIPRWRRLMQMSLSGDRRNRN